MSNKSGVTGSRVRTPYDSGRAITPHKGVLLQVGGRAQGPPRGRGLGVWLMLFTAHSGRLPLGDILSSVTGAWINEVTSGICVCVCVCVCVRVWVRV